MPSSSSSSSRRVHFTDTYSPSSLSLRLKLGPKEQPTMILRISVYFEAGKLPKIKVKTRKAKEKDRGRERRRRRRDTGEGKGSDGRERVSS